MFTGLLLLSALSTNAQSINLVGGGAMGKKVVVPKLDKVAVAQATVYFKHATTHEFMKNERGAFGSRKSGGSSVSGRLTAYLETTDGDLTASDYQELATGFYTYLNKKLQDNGIQTVEWAKVATADFYTRDGEALPAEGVEIKHQAGQAWVAVKCQ